MRALALLFASLSLASVAEAAKTLYVNPTHPSASDATTYANNSESLPWATLQRALTGNTNECTTNSAVAAAAGDTVIVTPGTYTESSPSVCGAGNFQPTFRPVNSGTSGNPITIMCENEGGCLLRAVGGYGPTFGVLSEDYITWRGFTVAASPGVSVPMGDTAPVTVSNCTGCIFENNTMSGGNRIWPMAPSGAPSAQVTITTSSAASPALFTTSTPHNVIAGDAVIITGHSNLTDGFYYVGTIPTATTLTLRDGHTGLAVNGTSGAGGVLQETDRNTNTNVFRANITTNLVLRNNTISGIYTAGNGSNGACVMTYAAVGLLFERNTIFDCGANIHLKGGNIATTTDDCFGCVIRYNLLYNCGIQNNGQFVGSCITLHVGGVASAAQPMKVYQNVMRNSIAPCMEYHIWDPSSAAAAPRYVRTVNNVFDTCKVGIYMGQWSPASPIPDPAGYVFYNNIFTNISDNVFLLAPNETAIADPDRWTSEHNIYALGDWTTFARVDYEGSPSEYATLANWKTGQGHDQATGNGGASVTTDPQYVDHAAGNFRTQAAFVSTHGVDFLDLDGDGSTTDSIKAGAYITGTEIIGRTNGLPLAPTNLRIVPPQ
jgi:hypothetical protein